MKNFQFQFQAFASLAAVQAFDAQNPEPVTEEDLEQVDILFLLQSLKQLQSKFFNNMGHNGGPVVYLKYQSPLALYDDPVGKCSALKLGYLIELNTFKTILTESFGAGLPRLS